MAAINRFLMILIVLLAIGAAVLSFLLFQRRTEFRDRASLLAETTVDMVQALDRESGTNVARRVSFNAADPDLKTRENGTLSLYDYHTDREAGYNTFKGNLQAAAQLAEKINQQRNYLAQTLDDIAFSLKMPSGEISIEDIKNASDTAIYSDAGRKVLSLAKASSARSDDMINTLISCANTIGHSLDDTMLRSRASEMDEAGRTVMGPFRHRTQLDEFREAVVTLNTRSTEYADAIAGTIRSVDEFAWQTDPDLVTNRRAYGRALVTLSNDVTEINVELRRSKDRQAMIERLNTDLDQAKTELSQVKTERDDLQTRVADQRLRIVELEQQVRRVGGTGTGVVGDIEVDPNLQGRVVQVNSEWNFVILDLGESDVYETLPLLVSRNDQFIGKIFVTKVARNISVAEIDTSLMKGHPQAGDMVFLPEGF